MKNEKWFNVLDADGIRIASTKTMLQAKKAIIHLSGTNNYLKLTIVRINQEN